MKYVSMDDGECEQSKLLGLRNVTSVIQQLAPVHDVLSLTLSWKIISHIKALEPYHQILAISNFNVDQVLINALAECYNSANSWESRRQILSIMADKVAFSISPVHHIIKCGTTKFLFNLLQACSAESSAFPPSTPPSLVGLYTSAAPTTIGTLTPPIVGQMMTPWLVLLLTVALSNAMK